MIVIISDHVLKPPASNSDDSTSQTQISQICWLLPVVLLVLCYIFVESWKQLIYRKCFNYFLQPKKEAAVYFLPICLEPAAGRWVIVRQRKQHKPLKPEWQQLWAHEARLWNGQRCLYLDKSPLLLLCGKQWFWPCRATFHHVAPFQQPTELNFLISLPTSHKTLPHFSLWYLVSLTDASCLMRWHIECSCQAAGSAMHTLKKQST